jgi:hypothetical protein
MIPGFIITWLTFPGVIVHEFAHKFFCSLTGTKVLQVCYFRFGNPAGYVIHENPATVWQHILIGIGPLFVNTGLGLLIGMCAIPFKQSSSPVFGALMWLAVSIAMHSFPSTTDAKSIWKAVWHQEAPISARAVGTPLVGLIFLGAAGSIVWLDLIYGVAIVMTIPEWLYLHR